MSAGSVNQVRVWRRRKSPRGMLLSGTNAAVLKYCATMSAVLAVIPAQVVGRRARHQQRVLAVRLQDAVLRDVGTHREHERAARLEAVEAGQRPSVQQGARDRVEKVLLRAPHPRRRDHMPPIEEWTAPRANRGRTDWECC